MISHTKWLIISYYGNIYISIPPPLYHSSVSTPSLLSFVLFPLLVPPSCPYSSSNGNLFNIFKVILLILLYPIYENFILLYPSFDQLFFYCFHFHFSPHILVSNFILSYLFPVLKSNRNVISTFFNMNKYLLPYRNSSAPDDKSFTKHRFNPF